MSKSLHPVGRWLSMLCVLFHCLGAGSGGVLCMGCEQSWGGVAVAANPCTPIDDCCSNCDSTSDQPQPHTNDCGCVDVVLPANASTLMKSPVKFVLAFHHHALPPAMILPALNDAEAERLWAARAGPPLVRLLVPSERQTVLVV